MKRDSGQVDGIPSAALHDALIKSSSYPTVVADEHGHVIEWNRAAENVTGISREYALRHDLWEVQARVAPAHIPYEVAIASAREQFDELVRLSFPDRNEWRRSCDGELLSITGAMHHIRSEIFPIWIENDLAIVSNLWERDDEAERALDDDYDRRVDQLERRICGAVYRTGRHTEEVDAYIHFLRTRVDSGDRSASIRLDTAVGELFDLFSVILSERRFRRRISPYLVRPIRAVEIALLLVELVLDQSGDISVVIRPGRSERRARLECVVDQPEELSRRWVVQDLLNRLDGQLTVRRGTTTAYDVDFPSAILAEIAPGVNA